MMRPDALLADRDLCDASELPLPGMPTISTRAAPSNASDPSRRARGAELRVGRVSTRDRAIQRGNFKTICILCGRMAFGARWGANGYLREGFAVSFVAGYQPWISKLERGFGE
jgi:hypothetical protein